MGKDDLESLLDSMLDESATSMAAEEVRAREAAEREARARRSRPPAEEEAAPPPSFGAIEELASLPDADLRRILAKAAPDDLLVVLATADGALQRSISRNLSADSLAWLRANLAHIDRVTDAERDGARAKVLKVAGELLAAGEIGPPPAEGGGGAEALDPESRALRELLRDLVRIAAEGGLAALEGVVDSAGEPLLREGLRLLVEGRRGEALRRELEAHRAELQRRYARGLGWSVEALLAIAEGEGPEPFEARVFGGE